MKRLFYLSLFIIIHILISTPYLYGASYFDIYADEIFLKDNIYSNSLFTDYRAMDCFYGVKNPFFTFYENKIINFAGENYNLPLYYSQDYFVSLQSKNINDFSVNYSFKDKFSVNTFNYSYVIPDIISGGFSFNQKIDPLLSSISVSFDFANIPHEVFGTEMVSYDFWPWEEYFSGISQPLIENYRKEFSPSFFSPITGNDFSLELNGSYNVGSTIHIFGGWDYLKLQREYKTSVDSLFLDNSLNSYSTSYRHADFEMEDETMPLSDYSTNFTHLGVTYDLTEKISVQGNFAYLTSRETTELGVEDNTAVIPGIAVKYRFTDDASVVLDYKYYDFSDSETRPADYKSNQIVTQLNLKF